MTDTTLGEYVDQLAARTPAPGGGSAAASTAVIGAALLLMVVRFARGKPLNQSREVELEAAESALQACVARLLPMGERDVASFQRVADAYQLSKATQAAEVVRRRAIQEGLAGAMVVPEEVACLVRDAFAAVDGVIECVGRAVAGDLGAGAELLASSASACECLVRASASYLDDRALAAGSVNRLRGVMDEVRAVHVRVTTFVDSKLGGAGRA